MVASVAGRLRYTLKEGVVANKPLNPFDIFHPVDHSIISNWLGITPPEGSPTLDELPLDDNSNDYIGLALPSCQYAMMMPCQNAVARIALRGVEGKLPQWAALYGNGIVVWGRDRKKSTRGSTNISLLPQFLFEINWADSAPGISWPESYHMTYIP